MVVFPGKTLLSLLIPKFSHCCRILCIPSVIIAIVFSFSPVIAQQSDTASDSLTVYQNIEAISKTNLVTRYAYGLVFKSRTPSLNKKPYPEHMDMPYQMYAGKIVRHISVTSLDPFGFSADDTVLLPKNMIARAGNAVHVKTQGITIQNILLFGKNKPFDPFLVQESERLIRGQPYVHDVAFFVVPIANTTDSVDVAIRVSDKWSLVPDASVSTSSFSGGFTENNFAGLGHNMHGVYTRYQTGGKQALGTDYYIPNIKNSYINTALHYNVDKYDNVAKSLVVERPFYSAIAKWAGGASISEIFLKDTVPETLTTQIRQNVKCNTQDYWLGNATLVPMEDGEENRTTKAVFAGRYLRIRYPEKPDTVHDSLHRFANEDFYVYAMGISARNWVRDRYIFNFGIVEDVPVGKVFGITSGYQIRNNVPRLYWGATISLGNYNTWGYLSSTFKYGTFVNGTVPQQGVFSASSDFFSNLFEIGNWRIRQFIKPQLTLGINRFSYDSLGINNENGIRGFGSTVQGTKKLVMTLQTQSYAPYNVWGFRFGPYLMCSLGMLGNESSGFSKSNVYSMLGLGTLIRNDYLVFSTFQLSAAYYPSIPGNGYNIVKINAFATTDFGFRDFSFGKPEIVPFQ